MTVPLVSRRPLAFAQVAPMNTQAEDQRKGVSQWAWESEVTDGIWKRKLAAAQPTGRHRHSIAFAAYRRIRLLPGRTGVIHVVTAVFTA